MQHVLQDMDTLAMPFLYIPSKFCQPLAFERPIPAQYLHQESAILWHSLGCAILTSARSLSSKQPAEVTFSSSTR